MRKQTNDYFLEVYRVKVRYQKTDGFWTQRVETIRVPVKHGVNEKNNHDRAAEQAKGLFPGCEVVSVSYY